MQDLTSKYWLAFYKHLREEGDYKLADELREMIRRMGYEIRVTKENYELHKI